MGITSKNTHYQKNNWNLNLNHLNYIWPTIKKKYPDNFVKINCVLVKIHGSSEMFNEFIINQNSVSTTGGSSGESQGAICQRPTFSKNKT